MERQDNLVVFSADGHAGADIETYRPYIEQEHWPALDDLVAENDEYLELTGRGGYHDVDALPVFDDRGAVRNAGQYGAWDIDVRLRELDAEGVAGELVHYGTQCSTSPFFGHVNRPCSPALRAAGARAYHRWLADFMGQAGGRLVGVADPGPCTDMDETLRDLRWAAEHGFVSVSVPGSVHDPSLPPLHDPYFEPFWSACDELGMVLSIHAGWGGAQGQFLELFAKLREMQAAAPGSTMMDAADVANSMRLSDDNPFRLDYVTRRPMWLLMAGGVFDRHPDLTLALTEVRADWVPATLAVLDRHLAEHNVSMELTPSEYYRRQVIVAPSSIHRSEVELRHELGVDQLLFGVDYPHWEGVWPNTRDWIRAAFAGVAEDEVRLILGENAIRHYGLDQALLAREAARIGPSVELLGDGAVRPELVDHFHQRSGFNRPADPVDSVELSSVLDADLALVTS